MSRVFVTSSGVVTAAANAPAAEPQSPTCQQRHVMQQQKPALAPACSRGGASDLPGFDRPALVAGPTRLHRLEDRELRHPELAPGLASGWRTRVIDLLRPAARTASGHPVPANTWIAEKGTSRATVVR